MAIQQIQQFIAAQEQYEAEQCADEVSAAELWAEIDQKARQYFNLSSEEFAHLYHQGAVIDTFAVAELGFLLRCLDDARLPA